MDAAKQHRRLLSFSVWSLVCSACLPFEAPAEKPDGEEESDTQCNGKDDFETCTLRTQPDYPYDICVSERCVSPGCGDAHCNVPGPGFPLPDTNLRRCYNDDAEMPCPAASDAEYFGQDAQYGLDTTYTDPETERFQKRGTANEPIVADHITGLDWQGCLPDTYGDRCQDGHTVYYEWGGALQMCRDLSWGGYSDWRLPDIYSLLTLVNMGAEAGATYTELFAQDTGAVLWSTTTHPGDKTFAFTVVFDAHPRVSYEVKTFVEEDTETDETDVSVRCVRGDATAHGDRFHRENGALVTDTITGLIWQGCADARERPPCVGEEDGTMDWRGALAYCEQRAFGGKTDWRLPSAMELFSIVNTRDEKLMVSSPSNGDRIAPGYWTSTTSASSASEAWVVSFRDGSGQFIGKGAEFRVRCVRDAY